MTCATYVINCLVFIIEMKSVYCAVRTGSLNKSVCASYLKGWLSLAKLQILQGLTGRRRHFLLLHHQRRHDSIEQSTPTVHPNIICPGRPETSRFINRPDSDPSELGVTVILGVMRLNAQRVIYQQHQMSFVLSINQIRQQTIHNGTETWIMFGRAVSCRCKSVQRACANLIHACALWSTP